ncbi:MAG TPA: hypothetical protein VGL99_11475 [Chloroflexota bacterium]|jgi:hypothetical protein
MQHPSTIEFNGNYHRQQLLAEAAHERLVAEARRAEAPRRAKGPWMARALVVPMQAALALFAALTPNTVASDAIGLDQ